MIIRREYRGCFKGAIDGESFEKALKAASARAREEIDGGKLVELCLYRHESMCFLYVETDESAESEAYALRNQPPEELRPENLLKDLTPFLVNRPEVTDGLPWSYMYPVYYQQRDIKDLDEWLKERNPSKTRVGRIAFLFPDTLPDYVRWHRALTEEGLLKGDKYQYISLHENVLFSYYEEPRNNVSILKSDEESKKIDGWLKLDTESRFDIEKTNGNHFLPIEPLIMEYLK